MILLVIDTQQMIVTNELYEYNQFVSNVKTLIQNARKNNIEIIYIRHDDGTELTHGVEGFEIFEEFVPHPGEKIFDKHYNSAFLKTGLREYLDSLQETQIMTVGLQTEYCFDATIKCGFEHGYHMIVPAYCNTTVDNQFLSASASYHYYNEFIWCPRYAECIPFEEALKRLAE